MNDELSKKIMKNEKNPFFRGFAMMLEFALDQRQLETIEAMLMSGLYNLKTDPVRKEIFTDEDREAMEILIEYCKLVISTHPCDIDLGKPFGVFPPWGLHL